MAKQINTILSLKDKMSSPLTKVSSNVTKVTREMKKSQNQISKWQKNAVKSIDKVVKKVGKIALATGALAAGVMFKVGLDGLKELDEASAKVKSIAGSSLGLKNIQKDLLKQSNKTGVGVNELAETQYQAISSGVKAADSMKASVQASKLAKAGFTDSASALKVMTATMNVFGLTGTKAMQSISDKLLVTQNLGVTSVNELAESLGTVTPIAKAAGLGIDDVLASTISLTKNGLNTAEAMTGLKGVMSSVIKPGKEATDMAKQLGIDLSVSAIKAKGFPKFLDEIKEKTGGSTDMLGKLFGNVRALGAVLTLTDENGFKDFNGGLDALKDSLGMTDEAFATMTNTVGWKLDGLKNTFKNTMTSIMQSQSGLIGEYLDKITGWLDGNESKIEGWVASVGEGISKMIGFVKGVVDFIKSHEKAITTILVFVGTMYAVIKAITALKVVLGALNTIWLVLNGTLMITPLGWIVLAIGAVVAAGYLLYRNWDKIKKKAQELGINFGELKDKYITPVIEALKNFGKILWDMVLQIIESFKPLIETFKTIFNQIKDVVIQLIPILMPIVAFIAGVFIVKIIYGFMLLANQVKAVIETIAGVLNGLMTILSGVIDFVVGVFTGNWAMAWEGVKSIFSGFVDILRSLWQGLVNLLTAPVDAVVNILDAVFKEKVAGVKKLWGELKEFFKHPIQGTVSLAKKGAGWVANKLSMQEFAKGGIATKASIFGEAGAEMAIPLKNTKRSHKLLEQTMGLIGYKNDDILPPINNISTYAYSNSDSEGDVNNISNSNDNKNVSNDNSKKLEFNIAKLADSIIVREQADIDKIGDVIFKKVSLAIQNS